MNKCTIFQMLAFSTLFIDPTLFKGYFSGNKYYSFTACSQKIASCFLAELLIPNYLKSDS